jgi:hypothetical protein
MVNKAGKTKLAKPVKKSGFIYKPRKFEDVKRRAEKPQGRYDSIYKPGFDTFRPKQGENIIRILPPTWDGEQDHYGYTVFVHSYVGADKSTYLCPSKMKKKHCPICKAAEDAKRAGEEDDAKQLYVREQTLFWVLNRDGEDKKHPLLYSVSGSMDRDILSQTVTSRTGKALAIDHPTEGYDVIIKRTGQGLMTRYVSSIDRESSPIADKQSDRDAITDYIEENPIPSVLKFYAEDYLEKIINGTTEQKDGDLEEEDEDLDEEDEEEEKHISRKKKRPVDEDEEEEEEDDAEDTESDEDDDGSDEEEERRPARGSAKSKSRKAAADDEDEEDEEEDEDESDDDEEAPFDTDDEDKDEDEPEEEEDEDDEEEEPAPKAKSRVKIKKKVRR